MHTILDRLEDKYANNKIYEINLACKDIVRVFSRDRLISNIRTMNHSYKFLSINLFLLISSCESDSDSNKTLDSNPNSFHSESDGYDQSNESTSEQKFYDGKGAGRNLNFETLLNNSTTHTLGSDGAKDQNKSEGVTEFLNGDTSTTKPLARLEEETAFQNLEESALEHKKSIVELRKINLNKDQTIFSLSSINEELVSEVKRLKLFKSAHLPSDKENVSRSNVSLSSLTDEIYKLKNSLSLKSRELQNLRMRNESLEGKIVRMDNLSFPKSDLPRVSLAKELPNDEDMLDVSISGLRGPSLRFEAVVTALNGKSKEAFYTEFFVLNNDLESILRNAGINLQNYSSIDSYAELWARSRKNSFMFPGIQKQIRSVLLELVEKGEGKRVRTDVDGAAKLLNLTEGSYFIIGTASLGKVGVTWSVPVALNSGINKISLTLANCSWSL